MFVESLWLVSSGRLAGSGVSYFSLRRGGAARCGAALGSRTRSIIKHVGLRPHTPLGRWCMLDAALAVAGRSMETAKHDPQTDGVGLVPPRLRRWRSSGEKEALAQDIAVGGSSGSWACAQTVAHVQLSKLALVNFTIAAFFPGRWRIPPNETWVID